MYRLRFPLLAAVCLIVPPSVVWSAPVPVARSGLEQVPDTAPIVLQLRGVKGTRDRFVTMMKSALPEVLDKFQKEMDDFLQNGKDGRKIRGLRDDGPIFLALTELPKVDAQHFDKVALILAVSDYKQFLDNMLTEEERKGMTDKGDGIQSTTFERETAYFLDRKGYAIITPNEDVAKSFTKKFTGLHTKMSKEQAAKLLGSDLGVYVSMEAVNKEYSEEIKKGKEGLDQLIAFGAAGGDESQKQFIELIKKAIGPTFQAIEDMQAVLATVEFRPGGLGFHLQSEMKDGSTTANLLQDSRPVEFKELQRMPPDRQFYIGMKVSAAMYKHLGKFIGGLPTGGTGDAAALMEELAKAGPNLMLSSLSFPAGGLNLYQFDDPAKAVDASLQMYRKMNHKEAKLKEKPTVKANAEKYGDFKLHSVQMAWDFDKLAEPAAKGGDDAKKQYIEAMKGILGEKTNIWFGTDGKVMVQINAPDWETAKKLLDQYTNGKATAGEVKGFKDARDEMPKQTSLMGLVDATHMFATILETVKPMLPPGVALPPGWPNLPAKSPSAYVGMAVTLQPSRGGFDLFITAEAAKEFYKAVVKPLVGG
jgi:hypothetical protein